MERWAGVVNSFNIPLTFIECLYIPGIVLGSMATTVKIAEIPAFRMLQFQ